MIFGKLNKVFEDQYKTLPLKKVRLKTDPKFDKLPYEGYILAEAPAPAPAPAPVAAAAAANPPGKSKSGVAGSFLKTVAGAYEGLKSGAQKFKEFGQGNISVLAELMGEYGERLLRSALDKSTFKLSKFGEKGFNTGYILKDDPYHAIISKYVGVDNLDLTFNIRDSSEYNKDTLYSIIFNNETAKTAFKNKELSNGNFQRKNYVKNSKVIDSFPNNGTFFIYNLNGEAVPELTSESVRFEYDPKFRGYKMGNSVDSKAEPGNGVLALVPTLFLSEKNSDNKTVNFKVKSGVIKSLPSEARKPFTAGGLVTDDETALNAIQLKKNKFGLDFNLFSDKDSASKQVFIVEISTIKTIPISDTRLKTTAASEPAPRSAPRPKPILKPDDNVIDISVIGGGVNFTCFCFIKMANVLFVGYTSKPILKS